MDYAIGSKKWPGLSKLIEEAGEVLQIAGKIIATDGKAGHWSGLDLVVELEKELADLHAAIGFVVMANDLNIVKMHQRTNEKLELFRKWHREQGA